jgi:hypothetical protein
MNTTSSIQFRPQSEQLIIPKKTALSKKHDVMECSKNGED